MNRVLENVHDHIRSSLEKVAERTSCILKNFFSLGQVQIPKKNLRHDLYMDSTMAQNFRPNLKRKLQTKKQNKKTKQEQKNKQMRDKIGIQTKQSIVVSQVQWQQISLGISKVVCYVENNRGLFQYTWTFSIYIIVNMSVFIVVCNIVPCLFLDFIAITILLQLQLQKFSQFCF